MPVYEYRCGDCAYQFEVTQSVHARPEDTVCPHCSAQNSTRLLSAFASTIKGTHKPGFAEMKAYNMLNERMDKFAKLPPIVGRRAAVNPNMTGGESGSSDGGQA
ncbi:MAG: zinc ribbon domain-containing protein [Nitrospiraceae bacterium]|nr:zinc ribbon domain-containing protein [Nitrospiraceae bacterium]